MLSTLLCALLVPSPQTIDGIRPAIDGMMPYAKAVVDQAAEDPLMAKNKDYFIIGYFGYKARFMIPLTNTKYTASIVGVCGTVLGLYDEATKTAMKTPASRIVNGKEDFAKFTATEQKAIATALTSEETEMYPLLMQKMKEKPEVIRDYSSGMALGGLSAYITLWHISPKEPRLLEYIKISLDQCVGQGNTLATPNRSQLATQLKAFSKFEGKNIDEATVREIGKQIELTLRASVPEKYRWVPLAK